MRIVIPALALWALVVGTVVTADAEHALAGDGIGLALFAAAGLALGTAAGPRGLWAAALMVPLAALEGEGYDAMLLAVVAVPATAVLVGAGAAAGWALRRATERVPIAGLAALAATVVAVVVVLVAEQRVVDHRPERPLLVDERRGSFAELVVGGPLPSLSRLGRVQRTTLDEGELAPLGADGADISGPSSLPAGWTLYRARDLVVFAKRGRVAGFVTTDPSAQLSRGVGVGDSLELVEERYDDFDCEGVALGSDSNEPVYSACRRALGGGVLLWIGGDPIDSIWIYRDR